MINPGMMISDRYEIIDKVGSGGMADVYKAKDHRLNRFVAIKILKQEYSSDAKFVSKFRGEAQSVAGLSHPNIVNVYDVGDDNGLYYIVMELVEGITLKKFIAKKGKLELEEAVGIGIQIAQGMEAAHDNHIIHRDIKPQNIIISKEGKVKVTDFGIAKAATSNTITSNAMGSVHYISPEQARGGYSDEKSDIYSLGVTMYEMLSGNVPFEGDSTVTVALAHIQEDARPLDEVDPEIPHSLSRIVQKCMQKKPEMRYLNAAALIVDLKRAIKEPDGSYVSLTAPAVDDSPTIKLSDKELDILKGASRIVPEPVEDTEPEQEEDSEDTGIDPKLERILKICSAVVAVILVVAVLLIVGRFAGWWRTPLKGEDSRTEATQSPTPGATEAAEGKVEVPGIVGYTLEEAENMLTEQKLRWRLEAVESEEEANTVTDQDPAEGELVDEYSRVTIYYSQEDKGVVIPNVAGYTSEDAMTSITDQGLKVAGTTEEYDDNMEAGKVIGTDPVIGSSVAKGTAVTIIISKGPESEQTKVPDIVGRKYEVALEKLADAGLETNAEPTYVYSDTVPEGRVVSQTVAKGTMVKRGTIVGFTVSLGPKTKATAAPTQAPTKEPSYEGSFTATANPFEYAEDDPATIKLVLTQDGSTKTVWKGTLSYSDFPRKFTIQGWSENNGTVTVCKNDQPGETYNVEFSKVD